MLDMQMYKDDAFNVRTGKELEYNEFCDTFLLSNQGSSFRRRYFNFLSSEPSIEAGFNYDTFSRMERLKLLKLNYAKLSGRCEKFPEGLIWLCWHGFPLKSIPFDLPLGNLVSLDMSYSKLEYVWAGNKVLLSLKILNLSHSQRLVKTPNFTTLPNLEKLILKGCGSLVEVCDTIGNLERLILLNLENCKSLRKYPNTGMLKSLQTLVLSGCESLKVVDSNGVIVNPSSTTGRAHFKPWHTLFQTWLTKLILKTPEHIYVSLPRSLVILRLQNCKLSDDDFPSDFNNLSMLQHLDLGNNHFLNLPRCIGSLHKLLTLSLTSCKELLSISGVPNVKLLQVNGCSSLESVTYQSALSTPTVSSLGCGKLREIQGMFKVEPMEKVNREILNNLGLYGVELIGNLTLSFTLWNTFGSLNFETGENRCQGLYEFGIFSTFLRREEIPSWCSDSLNKGSSSSISFVVPSHPNLRIQGLNVYSVYTLSNTYEFPCPLFTEIHNKSKDLKWIYAPLFVAIPEKENEQEELVWLSHWNFGNHLESGDEVDVLVIGINILKVKEFGINIVWGEEEKEEIKTHTHHHNHDYNRREVVGGDLSNYQFMSPRKFFLYHWWRLMLSVSRRKWFQEAISNRTTLKDLLSWLCSRD